MTSNRVLSPGTGFNGLLLLCCLTLSQPVAAARDLQEAPLPAGEPDRAPEVEVYQRLQQRPGGDAVRYVSIARFGNTLLRTGVDAVVLEAAAIRREAPDTTGVVPARTRDCGGRPVIGNIRRTQIVSGDRDCSAQRAQPEGTAQSGIANVLLRVPGVMSVRFYTG